MRSTRSVLAALALVAPCVAVSPGCGGPRDEEASTPDAAPRRDEAEPARPTPGTQRPAPPAHEPEPDDPPQTSPVEAGAMVAIPASKVRAGSVPGTPGRRPGSEMIDVEVQLGAFEIDLLPFPDDPGRPPETGVTWREAAAACEQAGKRLCHELEWELACEGATGRVYPYGDRYDGPRYVDPLGVASAAGVRGMGALGEWTLEVFDRSDDPPRTVRGPGDLPGDESTRRCAFRSKREPRQSSAAVGFRCCRGARQREAYRAPPAFDRIEPLGATDAFQAVIRSVPELSELHDDPQVFTREDLQHVMHISEPAGATATEETTTTWLPVHWIPRDDAEYLVMTGRDGRDGFVVVLDFLPGGRYGLAAGLVLRGDDDPVMLAYTRNPRHVQWLPCVGCQDGGLITTDGDRVSISQRW